jgi:hypothetical protein
MLHDGEKISSLNGVTKLSIPYSFASYQTRAGLSVYSLDHEGTLSGLDFTYHDKNGEVSFPALLATTYLLDYDETIGYKNPYQDVSQSSWYADHVQYVTIHKLMNGTSINQFSPNATTTRAMIVTVLYRLEGSPEVLVSSGFTDIQQDAYYANAVSWASKNKIVNGYGSTFGPSDTMTREQMATILYRYAVYKGYDISALDNLSPFKDSKEINSYAKSAINWAVDQKIITGIAQDLIAPQSAAQRAQVAAILERFINLNK